MEGHDDITPTFLGFRQPRSARIRISGYGSDHAALLYAIRAMYFCKRELRLPLGHCMWDYARIQYVGNGDGKRTEKRGTKRVGMPKVAYRYNAQLYRKGQLQSGIWVDYVVMWLVRSKGQVCNIKTRGGSWRTYISLPIYFVYPLYPVHRAILP